MMILLSLLISIAAVSLGACLQVEGQHVRMSDFGRLVGDLPDSDDEVVMRAPAVGVRRNIAPSELKRILRLPADSKIPEASLCIEQISEFLSEKRILDAIQGTFPDANLHVRIADFSRYPIPKGKLELSQRGLLAGPTTRPDQRIMWRGRVVTRDGNTFPTWVRLYISTLREEVVAKRDLNPGDRIGSDDIAIATRRVIPLNAKAAPSLAEITDHIPRSRIAAGTRINTQMLRLPFDVEVNESISVQILAEGVQLKLPAISQGRGRIGDWIWLKQTVTGKRMRAIITAPGQALIEAGHEKGEMASK